MPDPVDHFISRWEHSGAAERANYALFLSELCDLLGVPRPDPTSPDPAKNRYVFERAVTRAAPDGTTSSGFIDLYRAGHFVLETKQGANDPTTDLNEVGYRPVGYRAPKTGHGKRGSVAFDRALERAFHQARGYITSLPADEGRPPFLIVCDVGHSLDLYAEFSGTGGHYERFPDPRSHRITLADLRRPEILDRLRLVWTDPQSLDPTKKAAEVTRDIADRLARLAKSLEADRHDPKTIAGFLQRCLFTMFAEDVGLLPEHAFHDLLAKLDGSPQGFPVLIGRLWEEMATGTAYSTLLFREIAKFNGGLFEDTTALPLSPAQLSMLVDASRTDWSQVEPSIFGTLLTRALDPHERHKLGAHYTPRSYVERLVRPTILDPLREEWDAVRIAAASLHREADTADDQADAADDTAKTQLAAGKGEAAKKTGAAAVKLRAEAKKKDAEALRLVTDYHHRLCKVTVLDPACGTANFLYVTLEHLKRLEAEVLELVTALGGDATFEMSEWKVRPEQFLGLELNPNAVAIAQLVLWIGYFQWQRRTTGKADTGDRPLLKNERNIRQQDAVLAYDEKIPRRDPASGEVVQIWDGHTTKAHPVTGKEVPDESARIVVYDYVNPRRAEWPEAEFIVGNPPFIGGWKMREALGDGYVEALWKANTLPEKADFVMYWWDHAADLVAKGRCKRFGLITTNSITQVFQQRVIEKYRDSIAIVYAIPDHPWIDSSDGAAVRISMTVGERGSVDGVLESVVKEEAGTDDEVLVMLSTKVGRIGPNLQIGADLTSVTALRSNSGLLSQGVQLYGAGFIVTDAEKKVLEARFGENPPQIIKPYLGAKELVQQRSGNFVIDFFGHNEDEAKRVFPEALQHVQVHVKPERDANRRDSIRLNWWRFGWERPKLRELIKDIPRLIVTPEVSKHRIFAFVPSTTLPDNMLTCICTQDAAVISILSSTVHTIWALAAGGRMGMGNDPRYTKNRCFDPFPFPALEEGPLKVQLRELGERLDAHRKRQQALHPGLTLTGIYNVLEKLCSGEALNAKEKQIHDQGLVTLLRQIHDDIDAAVLSAYGWDDLRRADCLPATFGSPVRLVDQATPDRGTGVSRLLTETFEEEILTRLVALNHERAAEEKRGLVRWLRPEYQNPAAAIPGRDGSPSRPPVEEQTEIDLPSAQISGAVRPVSAALTWPDKLPEQVARLRSLLPETGPDPAALSARFGRASKKREDQIAAILETLRGLGL